MVLPSDVALLGSLRSAFAKVEINAFVSVRRVCPLALSRRIKTEWLAH